MRPSASAVTETPNLGTGAPPPIARLEDVSFMYPNGTLALGGVSFEVPAGSVVGVCGPSGCGKSSLLALLAGIRRPTGGSVEFPAESNVGSDGSRRHEVSMVFQKDTLLPWLTVDGNVRLFYKLNRARRAEAEELVPELLELAGLTEFKDAYPNQLSGGMRRRVAFITAMAAKPRLLLLDEPFSSLDEPTRISIHQDVLRIIKRLETTVLLVTHDLAEAASLCDEVLILSDRPGRVAARHPVPFGEERVVMELRQRRDFLDLYGALWEDLSLQIRRGESGEGAEDGE